MDTLSKISKLSTSRPGSHASADQVAAWYDQKSNLLRELASEAYGAERDLEEAQAAAAHARAEQLWQSI